MVTTAVGLIVACPRVGVNYSNKVEAFDVRDGNSSRRDQTILLRRGATQDVVTLRRFIGEFDRFAVIGEFERLRESALNPEVCYGGGSSLQVAAAISHRWAPMSSPNVRCKWRNSCVLLRIFMVVTTCAEEQASRHGAQTKHRPGQRTPIRKTRRVACHSRRQSSGKHPGYKRRPVRQVTTDFPTTGQDGVSQTRARASMVTSLPSWMRFRSAV